MRKTRRTIVNAYNIPSMADMLEQFLKTLPMRIVWSRPELFPAAAKPTMHRHSFYEWLFIRESGGMMRIHLSPPGVPHPNRRVLFNDQVVMTIQLEKETMLCVFGNASFRAYFDAAAFELAEALRRLLEASWKFRDCGCDEMKLQTLDHFIIERLLDLMRNLPNDVENSSTVKFTALAFIADNLSDPQLSTERIAAASGRSASTLNRLFRKEFGKSLRQYLIDERFRITEEALRENDNSIDEIVSGCGWGSRSYFSAAFRRRHGLPPAAWRRRETEADRD